MADAAAAAGGSDDRAVDHAGGVGGTEQRLDAVEALAGAGGISVRARAWPRVRGRTEGDRAAAEASVGGAAHVQCGRGAGAAVCCRGVLRCLSRAGPHATVRRGWGAGVVCDWRRGGVLVDRGVCGDAGVSVMTMWALGALAVGAAGVTPAA